MKGVSSLSEIKFLKGGYTMNGSKPLTKLKLSDLWKVVKVSEEEIWGDLQQETKLMVKKLLESSMEEEIMEYIGISRKYERSEKRQSQRNGYYERDLETELGKIEKLSVPRSRDGGFKTRVFERYERKRPLVKEAIREMFLAGVSTRRKQQIHFSRPALRSPAQSHTYLQHLQKDIHTVLTQTAQLRLHG
jgi:Transposase and inactivated derivatives